MSRSIPNDFQEHSNSVGDEDKADYNFPSSQVFDAQSRGVIPVMSFDQGRKKMEADPSFHAFIIDKKDDDIFDALWKGGPEDKPLGI
jgi:hypothetical protein